MAKDCDDDDDDDVNDDADDANNINGVGQKKSTYNPFCREMKLADGQGPMADGQ